MRYFYVEVCFDILSARQSFACFLFRFLPSCCCAEQHRVFSTSRLAANPGAQECPVINLSYSKTRWERLMLVANLKSLNSLLGIWASSCGRRLGGWSLQEHISIQTHRILLSSASPHHHQPHQLCPHPGAWLIRPCTWSTSNIHMPSQTFIHSLALPLVYWLFNYEVGR